MRASIPSAINLRPQWWAEELTSITTKQPAGNCGTPRHELVTCQRPAGDHAARSIHGVHLNHAFSQINPDTHHFTTTRTSCSLAHGFPLSTQQQMDDSHHPSWRIDAVARRWEVPSYSLQADA